MGYNSITLGIWGASTSSSFVNYYADPYWSQVRALYHGDGNSNDSSSNASNLTAYNAASFSNTVNKYGSYAMSFSAQGDYFYNVTSSGGWGIATGDFTIEAWVYPTFRAPSGNTMAVCHFNTSAGYQGVHMHINSNGFLVCDDGAAATTPGTIVVPLNTWTHIAAVKQGSYTIGFVNGVQCFYNSTSGQNYYNSTTNTLQVGKYYNDISGTGSVYSYIGYIDELRITKGIARYLTNFTPPVRAFPDPYAVIQSSYDSYFNQISAILHGESLTDSSIQPLTFTNSGAQVKNASAAYGAKSLYFDGASYMYTGLTSTLNMSGGTFTIEGWVNPTNYTVNPYLLEIRTSNITRIPLQIDSSGYFWFFVVVNGTAYYVKSTSVITAGVYTHFAAVLSSNTMYLFLNGVLQGTSTAGTLPSTTYQMYVGRYIDNATQGWFTGYLDDIRITNSTARYTANFNPPQASYYDPTMGDPYWYDVVGMFNGESLADISQYANTVTNSGVVVSPNAKYGSGSLYFNGSSTLYTATNSTLNLSAGDFTIEFWCNCTNFTSAPYFVELYSGANIRLALQCSTGGILQIWGSYGGTYNTINSSGTLLASLWYHVALTRAGSNWYLFLNGVLVYSGAFLTSLLSTTYRLELGAATFNSSNYLTGYLDDIRITKGIARYTNNFAVPSSAVPIVPGYISSPITRGLILDVNNQFDSSSTVYDISSYKRIGTNSGMTFTSTPTNQQSMVSASTNYVSFPDSSDFKISTFSVAFWVKTTTTSNLVIFEKDSNNGFSIQTTDSTYSAVSYKPGCIMINKGLALNTALMFGSIQINDGNYHHVVVTVSGTTGSIYIDGVNVTVQQPTSTSTFSTTPLYIGSRAGTYVFPGNLAKVRMYNVVLTAAEVQTLYSDVP